MSAATTKKPQATTSVAQVAGPWQVAAHVTLTELDQLIDDAIELASTALPEDDGVQLLMQAQENVSHWGEIGDATEGDFLEAATRVEALARSAYACTAERQTEGWRVIVQSLIVAAHKVHGAATELPPVTINRPQDFADEAGARLDGDEANIAGTEAIALAKLVQWANEAETFIQQVRLVAEISPAVCEVFRSHDLRINSPSWLDSAVDAGLHYVFRRQMDLIAEVTGARP